MTGSGSPATNDWSGIELGPHEASSEFVYTAFEYAADAIHVSLLDALPIEFSVFSYDDAAISVDGTADNDPLLGALDCVPPSFPSSMHPPTGSESVASRRPASTSHPSPDL